MDPRWLPWCWAAAAAGCAALFLLVQPWRREFQEGLTLTWRKPAVWLIPAGLLAADGLAAAWRDWRLPDWAPPPAARGTGEALLRAAHGLTLGDGAALAAGVALALNAGGLRSGLRRGVESLTLRAGRWVPPALFGSLAVVVADFSLCRMELPVWCRVVFSVLAAPLTGWVSSLTLAALLLAAGAEERVSGKKREETSWPEAAAAHSVRLWPWAAAHGLGWLGWRWLPDTWRAAGGWVMLLPGLALLFAPLVFLRVRHVSGARQGWTTSLKMQRRSGWRMAAWGAPAGLLFFLWAAAGAWLAAGPGSGPGWARITLASLHGLAHTWLTASMLGAWTALCLNDLPPPPPPSRPAARRSPSLS